MRDLKQRRIQYAHNSPNQPLCTEMRSSQGAVSRRFEVSIAYLCGERRVMGIVGMVGLHLTKPGIKFGHYFF